MWFDEFIKNFRANQLKILGQIQETIQDKSWPGWIKTIFTSIIVICIV
jgi:hypothetical protein